MTLAGQQTLGEMSTATIPSKYQRIILNKDPLKKGGGSPRKMRGQPSRLSLNLEPHSLNQSELASQLRSKLNSPKDLEMLLSPSYSSLRSRVSTND